MALIEEVEKLKKSEIRKVVDSRIREFERTGRQKDKIFSELCFCILTANFQAEKSIKIQEEIGEGFYGLSKNELAGELRSSGHRFPNARAEYIFFNRKLKDEILKRVRLTKQGLAGEDELREWLVKNIKGFGMKEASHFLRNLGFKNLAIIDFHIIDLLVREGLIDKPKTLTNKKYIEIEGILRKLADKLDLNLAELDLYLWYIETGKVLK